jgi:hypothetical protein
VVAYGADANTVTAVADTGYSFVDWSDGSTDNPRTDLAVTANISVTANFTIDTFTLDYTAGAGGSLTGETSQVVNYGADGTAVTAVADTGYSFVDWSDGSTDNPRTDLAVTANITVTANFVADTFTITSSAGVDGSIDPNGLVTVAYGSNQVYTATPDAGYRVNKWLLDGSQDQAGGTVYTLSDITANHTVTVTFK